MKKIIYVIALLMIATSSFISCTNEEIKPKAGSGEGHVIDKGF
jgi:hypothetical protein